jgi:hypothetical protein
MKLNLITVCVDSYPSVYARKLITRFKEVTNFDVEVFCITDKPNELKDIANIIEPPVKIKGWWNKMFLYSDIMPEGWNLYLDLDIVICNSFDEELRWIIDKNQPLTCVSDAIGWLNNKYSSSMLMMQSGKHNWIFEEWLKTHSELYNYKGGDQVWTGRLLKEKGVDVLYVDKHFSHIKANLKYHLGKRNSKGTFEFPLKIHPSIKMVDCGGKPKPHQIKHLPYITENWHDI